MGELRAAAERALRYMESVGQADMYPEEWQIALDLRAALAAEQPQPVGEVVVTRNERGEIVMVSRQDEDGRVLSVIAEAALPPPAPAEQPQPVHHFACSTTRGGGCDCYYVWGAGVNLGGRLPVFKSVMGAADPEKTPPPAAAPSEAQDAARYRWLRAEHECVDPLCHVVWKRNGDRDGSEWVNTANLDAAIDAALAAREGR